MKPSEIAKSVLGKKSIFDDDYQRLKNINDKYEPGDFSNIVKTPPAIPNLAATKTPVVGCSSILGTSNKPSTPVSMVFSAPSNLQRLNSSPMNSPQASVSPYNSPSPSPNISLCSTKPTSIIQPQPAKGLQYPFPSHPPCSQVPALSTGNSNAPSNSNSSGNAPEAQNIPTKLTETKTKAAPIVKSYSVPNDKHLVSSQTSSSSSNSSVSPSIISIAPTPSRTLTKSISVPGSTNCGTVKVSNTSSFNTPSALPSNNANKIDEVETDSIKSSTAQLHCQSQLKNSNSSKKIDKLHKQNSKGETDIKKINSKTEKSIEKIKSEEFDVDTSEIDKERQKKEQEEREKLEYEKIATRTN